MINLLQEVHQYVGRTGYFASEISFLDCNIKVYSQCVVLKAQK